jgi:hypothetical protein
MRLLAAYVCTALISAVLALQPVLGQTRPTDDVQKSTDPADLLRATTHFARAIESYRSGAHDRAVDEASKALALNPNLDGAWSVRGHSRLQLKQFSEAAGDFRRVLERKPDDQNAIFGLNETYRAGAEKETFSARLVRLASPSCEPACPEWISLHGRIEAGSADQFKAVISKIGNRKIPVFVDSPGGSVADAMSIGRKIRELGLNVVVTRTVFAAPCQKSDPVCKVRTAGNRFLGSPAGPGAVCASSCGFLLASGVQRFVGASSLVGVHQLTSFQSTQKVLQRFRVYREMRDGKVVETKRELESVTPVGPKETVQTATGDTIYVQVRRFFSEMSIDLSIIELLVGAPPNDMHWLSHKELDTTLLRTVALHGEDLLKRDELPRMPLGDGPVGKADAPAAAEPSAAAPVAQDAILIASIQKELARLGCGDAGEKTWGAGSKRALERFNLFVAVPLKASVPSQEMLDTLRGRTNPVCPSACPPDLEEYKGRCLAKGAPRDNLPDLPKTAERTKPSPEAPAVAPTAKAPVAKPAAQPQTTARTEATPRPKVAAKACRPRAECESDCINNKIAGYRTFAPGGFNGNACIRDYCTRYPSTC